MNKRGVSEMVSYVLLIVISMSIATGVYFFLQGYVPKDKPECQEGVNMIVEQVQCASVSTQNLLSISFQNRGLFKIDKAYIRIARDNRVVKDDVPSQNPIQLINKIGDEGLSPGESTNAFNFPLPGGYATSGNYILEIQPAHYTKDKDVDSLALCAPFEVEIICN